MRFFYIKQFFLLSFAAGCFAPQIYSAHDPEGMTRFEANAPVSEFSLPKFGENGFKAWDLSGKSGRYVSNERIDIEQLRLRLFSGDEAARVEVTIESPQAVVNPQQEQAGGKSFLYVHGPGYSVTGRDWFWDDRAKTLKIGRDVQVTFSSGKEGQEPVVISSERLTIETQAQQYYFRFEGKVKVINGDIELETPVLQAWSGRTQTSEAGPQAPQMGHMRRILADDGVVVLQQGRRLTARRAEMPELGGGREIELTGSPEMRDLPSGAVLRGERVRLWRDRRQVEVFPKEGAGQAGRVRAILPAMEKQAGKQMEISGERLEMSEDGQGRRSIVFFDKVKVDDPDIKVSCDRLTAQLEDGAGVADGLRLPSAQSPSGQVKLITAQGHVVIDQQSRRTEAPQAVIRPKLGEAELTGNPVTVVDLLNGSILEGERIILAKEKAKAIVFGGKERQARLTLPPLAQSGEKYPTNISADSLQMTRGKDVSAASFLDNVKVDSGDMHMRCEALDVFVSGGSSAEGEALSEQSLGRILRIEGRGHVSYAEEDVRGEAARVEVFPRAVVKEADASEETQQRFVSLYGDKAGKQGPERPIVYLPSFKADLTGEKAEPSEKEISIESDRQELFARGGAGGSRFYFGGGVVMKGADFEMNCGEMEVVCPLEGKGENSAEQGAGSLGRPEKVTASKDVRIVQGTKTARAGFAEVSLRTGKCVLGENPVVEDSADNSRVEGYRITLLRDQNRIFVEPPPPEEPGAGQGKPSERKRPTVILPQMGDMGFDEAFKSRYKETQP